MRSNKQLVIFAAIFSLILPNLYGMIDCGGIGANDFAEIVSPVQGEEIPGTGLFTAVVDFPATLTPSSILQIELQDGVSLTVDVTASFLPGGQSHFGGASSVTADLDAVALGFSPGPLTFVVRLDQDGVDGFGVRAVGISLASPPGGGACDEVAGQALSDCFVAVSDAARQCYASTGAACSPSASEIVSAQNALTSAVTTSCSDVEVQSLGYGASMTAGALAARLNESCIGNTATLAARTFGGPHATVLAAWIADTMNDAGEICLDAAFAETASFLDTAFQIQRSCVLDPGSCVASTVDSDLANEASLSASVIDATCGAGFLGFLVGVPTVEALARARAQSECMLSAAHGNTSPLSLACAPTNLPPGVTVVGTQPSGLTPLTPGVATQVMLDEAVWGTRCGDGTPYAFWIKLAPPGSPAGNMVTHLQGGGVCVFENQCLGVGSALFSALDDGYSEDGYLSSDPAENAFANWTKLFMPYCTQDVFAGGGATQQFMPSGLIVERYGAVNARAALRVLRNVVANEMNNSSPDGFRPDLLQVVFGGSSAGGFGVMFNLHHVLDEERWSHTTFINDAALGLDTGLALGVGTLGGVVQVPWATPLAQPPYCLATDCAVGPILNAAHSARLLGTPEQQLLILTNQVDNVQVNTTFWPDTPSFVNAARTEYCNAETLPGVRYYLDAIPASIHTYLRVDSRYYGADIATVPPVDWVEQAVFDPTNLVNLVEEGTLTTAFPGVLPFPCP